MSDILLLKLGGSVITEKNLALTAREDTIERLASEIAEAKEEGDFDLVIVNGAGSFGHYPVQEYGLMGDIPKEKMFEVSMVHKHVEDLNRKIWDALIKHKFPAVPIHPMSFVYQNEAEIEIF
ncbi:MAG: hypothetical protein JXA43_00715, partial [Candidatus Diapherotrites archaeon]|nr:hypothetical protein [Candidatus Diapherotrites archaeon]